MLRGFFRRASDSPPADKVPAVAALHPPQPQGAWKIIVDSECRPVTNRAPQAGDMLARPAVDYLFKGTIPYFTPDARRNQLDNISDRVDHDLHAHANQSLLDQAVFLLSQDDDGRRLLQAAKSADFAIVFDVRRLDEYEASGLMDFRNKIIPVRPSLEVSQLALTLKHELEHMDQFARQKVSPSPAMTLQDNIMTTRAIESGARVSEAVTAAGLMIGSPQGPAEQYVSDRLYKTLAHKNPELGARLTAALPAAQTGQWDQFAAHVFPAFYESEKLMAFYDRHVISDIIARDARDIRNKTLLHNQGPGAHEIKERLSVRGHTPYLKNRDDIDLNAPAYAALSPASQEIFEQLSSHIKKTANLDPEKLIGAMRPSLPADEPETQTPHSKGWLQKWFGGRAHTQAITAPAPAIPPPTAAAAPPFQPVIMPGRIDGNMLTNGQRAHEATTTEFLSLMQKNRNLPVHDMLKISFAVDEHVRRRGSVNDLLQCGLRAPIGAFPLDYIRHLGARLQASGQRAYQHGAWDNLIPEEKELIQHWRKLADEGLNPVWLKSDGRVESDNRSFQTYANVILKMTGIKEALPSPQNQAAASSNRNPGHPL